MHAREKALGRACPRRPDRPFSLGACCARAPLRATHVPPFFLRIASRMEFSTDDALAGGRSLGWLGTSLFFSIRSRFRFPDARARRSGGCSSPASVLLCCFIFFAVHAIIKCMLTAYFDCNWDSCTQTTEIEMSARPARSTRGAALVPRRHTAPPPPPCFPRRAGNPTSSHAILRSPKPLR